MTGNYSAEIPASGNAQNLRCLRLRIVVQSVRSERLGDNLTTAASLSMPLLVWVATVRAEWGQHPDWVGLILGKHEVTAS